MQKSSTEYKQAKFNSTLTELDTMTQWDLFLECKDGTAYENQSV